LAYSTAIGALTELGATPPQHAYTKPQPKTSL
jgi:hypothetical protein